MARRFVGKLVAGIGAFHLATSVAFYRDDLVAIIDRGVLNAVEPAGAARVDAGFWYVSAGLTVVSYGGLVWWYERHVGDAPAITGWLLLVPAVWGVVLMPTSGFWALLVPAVIAIRSARRSAGSPVPDARRSVL